jgi:hypothetical protein
MPDPVSDNVHAIILAAKDLVERGRALDMQERFILRDAQELISEVLMDDLLAFNREFFNESRPQG